MRIDEIVGAMEPPRYTTAQAAKLVGRSEDTLKRWRDDGHYVPTHQATFGSTIVWLYTHEDVVAMRQLARRMRPGPKPGTPYFGYATFRV